MLWFERGRRRSRERANTKCTSNNKTSIIVNERFTSTGLYLFVSANILQTWRKSQTIFLASLVILPTVLRDANAIHREK
jgi:hypothetical protein